MARWKNIGVIIKRGGISHVILTCRLPYVGVNNRCGLHLTNYGVAMVPNSAGVMVNVISWGLSGPEGIEEGMTNFRCRLDGQNTHTCEYITCSCYSYTIVKNRA